MHGTDAHDSALLQQAQRADCLYRVIVATPNEDVSAAQCLSDFLRRDAINGKRDSGYAPIERCFIRNSTNGDAG